MVYSLGTILWELRTKETIPQCIWATHQRVRDNYAEQVLNIISAEQNIASKECLDEMPLLVQLILEPDCEELCLCSKDERVLSFSRENLMEVTDENGQRGFKLPLSWKDGYPVHVPRCLPIAMQRLCLYSKLAQQPEITQRYVETFENKKRAC